MPEDFAAGVRSCLDPSGTLVLEKWGAVGLNEIAPLWMLKRLPNMPACHLAIFNDLRGPVNTITQRDVGANQAVAEGCRWIQRGEVDAVLVGATSSTLPSQNRLHARLESDLGEGGDEAIGRPFDRRRSGPAPGEGAGALVLERLSVAQQRGAKIYGEIRGCASSASTGRDLRRGCRKALVDALQLALMRAATAPADVGHVHAHGLSTVNSDFAEAEALKDVFGDRLPQIPVVATKGRLSNTGTASGLIELIVSVLALEDGRLFPVPNSTEPDPGCPVHLATQHDRAGDDFLNLSLFGRGLASCVAVARLDSIRRPVAGGAR